MNHQFIKSYFCFSVSGTEKSHLEDGNRIVMPESSLQRLINKEVDFPYYFHITKCIIGHDNNDHTDSEDEWNFSDHDSDYSIESTDGEDDSETPESDPDQKQSDDDDDDEEEEDSETQEDGEIGNASDEVKEKYPYSHCGVSEFTSDEGTVLLPQWIMSNLGLQNGDSILLRSVRLKNGLYVKLNPLNRNFLKISNPKAVLETKLRRFTCLTPGDIIPIVYNNVTYDIHVVETKPPSGISIIETDCEVEFFLPEPEPAPAPAPAIAAVCRKEVETKKTEDKATVKFGPFSGMARRLDGVEVKRDEIASVQDGIGKIVLDSKLIRQPDFRKEAEDEMEKKKNKFQAFSGKSRNLLDN